MKDFLRNWAAIAFGCFVGFSALANPIGGQVTQGQATITSSGSHTQIDQSSNQAVINWHSFNIGKQESTHFQQPHGGVALNRIDPAQGFSAIYGKLTATGKIILINSAGVYFGPGSYVHVGGIIATTANITDQDFMGNKYIFNNPVSNSGFVINEGTIIAKNNGLVALVAPGVMNNGVIQAKMGHIILASGGAFTISFSPQGMIAFKIDAATTNAGIDNNGKKMTAGVANYGVLKA
ncbi:MAG: filamentous hemagglutinin N-terminal domain-containing protein, partial [Gammaproteobacteria bacterium]|nr:filamentous hemagglutinin N-terminal domain-containing protein [Gammaproteobacteria bacterium]